MASRRPPTIRMPHPLRHSRRTLALLATCVLTTASAAHAQPRAASGSGDRLSAFLSGRPDARTPGQQRASNGYDTISETLDAGAATAGVSGNARTGKLGAIALTDAKLAQARARVTLTTQVRFKRPVGLGALQPVELYTHGSFFDADDGRTTGSGETAYGAQLRVLDRWGDEIARGGDQMEYWSRKVLPLQAQRTLWFELPPAVAPGFTETFQLVLTVWAYADNGFGADASHTGSVFIPTIAGQEWEGEDGAFSEQARPAWASPGPVTTAPEPATVALVATGLVLVLVRRRRAHGSRGA